MYRSIDNHFSNPTTWHRVNRCRDEHISIVLESTLSLILQQCIRKLASALSKVGILRCLRLLRQWFPTVEKKFNRILNFFFYVYSAEALSGYHWGHKTTPGMACDSCKKPCLMCAWMLKNFDNVTLSLVCGLTGLVCVSVWTGEHPLSTALPWEHAALHKVWLAWSNSEL